MPQYFGNYKRVVYLGQSESPQLQATARQHAQYLGLDYEYLYCGLDPLALVLKPKLEEEALWQN
jgi:hypothetical protein